MARTRTPSPIGTRLRQIRTDAGLTQAQLAEKAEIADATLSRIERNRLVPSVVLAGRLAKALRVKVDDLFEKPRGESKKPTLRPSEARLLGLVRDLDDAGVDDVAKAVKMIMAAARRPSGQR